MKNYNVLYVDDEEENLTSFKYLFKKEFDIFLAASAREGLVILKNHQIQVVISDQKMPEMTGVEFLEKVADEYPEVIRILLTGYSDISAMIAAVNKGKIYQYFSKPFEIDEMRATLNKAMELYDLRSQNKELLDTLVETNKSLEIKVQERTYDLQKTLNEVKILSEMQNGDYYLLSLLTEPLGETSIKSNVVKMEFFIKQKKQFKFKTSESEIGGDINVCHSIQLGGKDYIIFINADAMGKSLQGAGGIIVFGSVFKSIMERTKDGMGKLLSPDKWLLTTFFEIHKVFETFNGMMLLSGAFCLVEEKTGLLYYIVSDHPAIVLYRNNKAEFLENRQYHKLGVGFLNEMKVVVETFQLNHCDSLILGSDGRDDILIGRDIDNYPVINPNGSLFLKHIENGFGNLEKIYEEILKTGEQYDDISLASLQYLG